LTNSSNNAAAPPTSAPAVDPQWLDAVLLGGLGSTVRCTPDRRTVMCTDLRRRVVFAKLRRRRHRDGRRERDWLTALRKLGFAVPEPVCWLERRGRSVLVTLAAAGRGADVLWWEHERRADLPSMVAFACRVVAPTVRRLHDLGLVFRDLYWGHLFATGSEATTITLLDVERVLRPRFRFNRWLVKDIAGLVASLPVRLSRTDRLRMLRSYLGSQPPAGFGDWKVLATAVLAKAARIRGHRPKYG
jgi:hypothetical protein